MSRGHDRERDVRELLNARGWVTVRAAGSLGPVDVVALTAGPAWQPRTPEDSRLNAGGRALFIEVKSTADGPYKNFSRDDRSMMLNVSQRAGAEPWLCWWPPCKPGERKDAVIKWIPGDQWPAVQNLERALGQRRGLPVAPPAAITSADVQGAIRPDRRGDRRPRKTFRRTP